MNLGRLLALWHARNLEFLRDRSTLIFNFLFPLALVVAFAVIFGGQPRALFKVDVVAPPGAALDGGLHPFLATRHVDFVRIEPGEIMATVRKVERHQVDLLVDLRAAPRYWINEDSPKGYLAEKLLLESASGRATREPVSGAAVRYVDWLLPGILGMNMMFSCLFGVGYVVVRYRKSGFLRRLSATPVTAFEFGAAQVLSRLLLTVSRDLTALRCPRRLRAVPQRGKRPPAAADRRGRRARHDLLRVHDGGALRERGTGERRDQPHLLAHDAAIRRLVLARGRARLAPGGSQGAAPDADARRGARRDAGWRRARPGPAAAGLAGRHDPCASSASRQPVSAGGPTENCRGGDPGRVCGKLRGPGTPGPAS